MSDDLRFGKRWAVRLNEEQALKLEALAFLRDCTPHEVARRLLDELDDPVVDDMVRLIRKHRMDAPNRAGSSQP